VSEAGASLSSLVRAAARARPDAPAVVAGQQRRSWAELDAAVDRVAAGFATQGLAPGDRVAVQLPNGLDWV
jgi:long-chain acyl-CoA synthetase